MPYASNTNAILIDGCANLQGLSVRLEAIEDIATTDGSGWSLQLNCYPPPGEYCQASQLNFLQYLVVVQDGNLEYYVQYDALKWLGQASCKLPPSMHGVGAAGETVLESLRGRTLDDGLNVASKTVLPRFSRPGVAVAALPDLGHISGDRRCRAGASTGKRRRSDNSG